MGEANAEVSKQSRVDKPTTVISEGRHKEATGSSPGVLTQDRGWSVEYPDKPICAVRGFSVSIPCSYVYNSSSNTTSDFEFTGDDKSHCTLLIHNVQFSYSGEYKFRFITDVTDGRYTGVPGVTLQVAGDDPENPENLEHWSIWVIVCVTAGVSVVFSVIIGTVIHNRRSVHSEQQKNEDDSATYSNIQQK
ncbi:hypothetical protein QTP70_017707 [Hemibagrus guttatus]|uniref:Uncharacterized protein n=1 Tax=Hemibagrus guttatus TaxID=175788 RepID=A0AAE0Q7L6_9TELE|nr:hypothetical protein QTP70_017707 [Hemibagrus guttatus]